MPALLQYLIFRHNKENSETITRPSDGGVCHALVGGVKSTAAYVSIRQQTSADVGCVTLSWGGQEFQQSASLNQGNIERCTF